MDDPALLARVLTRNRLFDIAKRRSLNRREPQGSTSMQAAFRAAHRLPIVDAVAVGTDSLDHLRELTGSLALEVGEQTVREYRELLRAPCQPARRSFTTRSAAVRAGIRRGSSG